MGHQVDTCSINNQVLIIINWICLNSISGFALGRQVDSHITPPCSLSKAFDVSIPAENSTSLFYMEKKLRRKS
jgi:hypothetical protein